MKNLQFYYHGVDGPQEVVVSKSHAIEHQKQLGKSIGYEYRSDLDALSDFISRNWAVETNKNVKSD